MINIYENNPFRILGIPMDCDYKVVEYEYRKLNGRAKVNRLDHEKINDPLEWISKVERNQYIIQQAYNNIKDSEERLKHRLFWIRKLFVCEPIYNHIDRYYKYEIDDIETNIEIQHLLGVALHSVLSYELKDEIVKIIKTHTYSQEYFDMDKILEWEEMFRIWEDLLEEERFWDYLYYIEEKSLFQPVATYDEMENLKEKSWGFVLEPIIDLVEQLIKIQRIDMVEPIMNMIYTSDLPTSCINQTEEQIFGPIEDELENIAEEILKELKENLKNEELTPNQKKEKCDNTYQLYEEKLWSIYSSIDDMMFIDDSIDLRITRMSDIIVSFLRSLSIIYHNDVNDYEAAFNISAYANNLVKDSITRIKVQKDLKITKEHYERDVLNQLTTEVNEKLYVLEQKLESNKNNEEEKKKICDKGYEMYQENISPIYNKICSIDNVSEYTLMQGNTIVVKFIRHLATFYHNECRGLKFSAYLLNLAISMVKDLELKEELQRDLSIVNHNNEEDMEEHQIYIIHKKCHKIVVIMDNIKIHKNKRTEITHVLNNAIDEINKDIIPILKDFNNTYPKGYKDASDMISCVFRSISIMFHNEIGDYKKSLEILEMAEKYCNDEELIKNIYTEMEYLNRKIAYKIKENRKGKNFREFAIVIILIIVYIIVSTGINNNSQKVTSAVNKGENNAKINIYNNNNYQLSQEIEEEVKKLKVMEKRLQDIENYLNNYMSKVESYKQQIESNKSAHISSDFEIKEYNKYVDLYNTRLSQYKEEYSKYEVLLNEVNEKIDLHNNKK